MVRLSVITAVAFMLPHVAAAATITFGTAPTIAATRDCSTFGSGPLELLDEGGLRVRLGNPFVPQNTYSCDPATTVFPVGAGGGWYPIDEIMGGGLRSMTIWWADAGTVSVESLDGADLLGLTANYTDRFFVTPDRCNARVVTNSGAFDFCQGLNQTLSFADYGLTGVQRFTVTFSRNVVFDPNVQLLAVQVVPEPAIGLLLSLVVIPLATRARRRAVGLNRGAR